MVKYAPKGIYQRKWRLCGISRSSAVAVATYMDSCLSFKVCLNVRQYETSTVTRNGGVICKCKNRLLSLDGLRTARSSGLYH